MNLIWAPPVALVVKNLPANEGDVGDADLLPELGRSLRVGNDTSLQYSCLENFMVRGAWWATVQSMSPQNVGSN